MNTKTIFLFLSLFICSLLFAQSNADILGGKPKPIEDDTSAQQNQIVNPQRVGNLSGFLNVKWGETKLSVKAKMLKQGYKLTNTLSNLLYYSGKYCGYDATITLGFYNNKFALGTVARGDLDNGGLSDMCKGLYAQIVNKYGEPDSTKVETLGSTQLKAVTNYWIFPTNSNYPNTITMMATDPYAILIAYHNGEYMNKIEQGKNK